MCIEKKMTSSPPPFSKWAKQPTDRPRHLLHFEIHTLICLVCLLSIFIEKFQIMNNMCYQYSIIC